MLLKGCSSLRNKRWGYKKCRVGVRQSPVVGQGGRDCTTFHLGRLLNGTKMYKRLGGGIYPTSHHVRWNCAAPDTPLVGT